MWNEKNGTQPKEFESTELQALLDLNFPETVITCIAIL